MNCKRCGGPINGGEDDRHADVLTCWQHVMARIRLLEAHEHGADYAPPVRGDYAGAIMPDSDGSEYHQRADVVDGQVLHDETWHGR